MCDQLVCGGFDRRKYMKLAGRAAVLGFAGGLLPGSAYADALT
jgi:hypothetical protein